MIRSHERDARWCRVHTARMQRDCAHLWLEVYHKAIRQITWGAQADLPWVFIRLPFPFTDEDVDWSQRVAALWDRHGYELRPGGAAGHAQDIIRLDRKQDSTGMEAFDDGVEDRTV